MSNQNEAELAKQIVDEYRANGIGAKVHGGRPYLEREEGWDGPLDPNLLRETYREDIGRIVTEVRPLVARIYEESEDELKQFLGKSQWLQVMSSQELFALFERLGFSVHKARLYANVAMHLRWKGDL